MFRSETASAFLGLIAAALTVSAATRSGDFGAPIDSAYPLSASFGEFRPGHLHAGIDYSTFGKTGVPVRAVADGVVYRVRSSPRGYGNVLYLQHGTEHRSVYAHLERLAPKIEALLPEKTHFLGGSMVGGTMEVFPKDKLQVRKGSIVGWAGESGSGLPHLHFEWRDINDRPLNPVMEGVVKISDRTPPKILAIVVEPADTASSTDAGARPVELRPYTGARPQVYLAGRGRILLSGYDEDGRDGGRLGFTRVVMRVDGKIWTEIFMDSFTYGRDKDAGLIYDFFSTGFSPTVYTYDLTAPDGAGEVVSSKGPFRFGADSHLISVEAFDLGGNGTSISFILSRTNIGSRPAEIAAISPSEVYISRGGISDRRGEASIPPSIRSGEGSLSGQRYRVDASPSGKKRRLAGEGSLDDIPPGITVFSIIDRGRAVNGAVADPVLVGPYGLPVKDALVSIADPSGRANGMARLSHGRWKWIGGSMENGFVHARTDFLAPFVLMRDEAGPRVTSATVSERHVFQFEDDLSGVDASSIRVSQGARVLGGRFDPDRGIFVPSEPLSKMRLRYRVEVRDNAGNSTLTEIEF